MEESAVNQGKIHVPLTLMIVETQLHDMARLALDDCLRVCTFDDVLVISDRDDWVRPNERFQFVENYPTQEQLNSHLWTHLPDWFNTSHVLTIQYDSWILDADAWQPAFMEHDYIGPWWKPFDGDKDVGCGGFCISSRAMLKHIAERPKQYPHRMDTDIYLCRLLRPWLERDGFKWAPKALAQQFGFEAPAPYRPRAFGYHGVPAWPCVMSHDQLVERLKVYRKYNKLGKIAQLMNTYGHMSTMRLMAEAEYPLDFARGSVQGTEK